MASRWAASATSTSGPRSSAWPAMTTTHCSGRPVRSTSTAATPPTSTSVRGSCRVRPATRTTGCACATRTPRGPASDS
ncbi:hypothetical protein G6F62_014991 [Rhizopus arrhizus]|nr:hypothetical protein G6F62_014991 [Rhizopus arrhizus]